MCLISDMMKGRRILFGSVFSYLLNVSCFYLGELTNNAVKRKKWGKLQDTSVTLCQQEMQKLIFFPHTHTLGLNIVIPLYCSSAGVFVRVKQHTVVMCEEDHAHAITQPFPSL